MPFLCYFFKHYCQACQIYYGPLAELQRLGSVPRVHLKCKFFEPSHGVSQTQRIAKASGERVFQAQFMVAFTTPGGRPTSDKLNLCHFPTEKMALAAVNLGIAMLEGAGRGYQVALPLNEEPQLSADDAAVVTAQVTRHVSEWMSRH